MFNIEKISKNRIVFMRKNGPYGAANKEVVESLKGWASANKLMNDDAIILGIAQDNPTTTPPECCRYDACIVVPEDYVNKDAHVHGTHLPGGIYAVFTLRHTAADIQKAWIEILPEITSKGYQIDGSKPILERYIPGMINKHQCEICVPIY